MKIILKKSCSVFLIICLLLGIIPNNVGISISAVAAENDYIPVIKYKVGTTGEEQQASLQLLTETCSPSSKTKNQPIYLVSLPYGSVLTDWDISGGKDNYKTSMYVLGSNSKNNGGNTEDSPVFPGEGYYILYGLAAATMLAAVITWFSCYTAVMTSDKFVYLFGRVIPALSLVLSMALRFVPKFQTQFKVVSEAQQCIGRDIHNGGVIQRLRNAVTTFSIMLTWSLENAIETADSMKSRGYGLPGRTAFSIYRFDSRDRAVLGWLVYCGVFLCCGAATGAFTWRYYPTAKGAPWTPLTVCLHLIYLAACLTPLILDVWEERKWRRLYGEKKGIS